MSGQARSFVHDANGNLTSDATRTFEWNAVNQLVAVTEGTGRVEFAYDGIGQRTGRAESLGESIVSALAWVRCEFEVCESRSGDGTSVHERALRRGQQSGVAVRFFAKDHLDSVRIETDETGVVESRYDYDPWGRRTLAAGLEAAPSYATLEVEPVGGLSLAQFRWYDPELARWGSEDPSGAVDGPNLFTYVRARPTSYIDPAGLQSVKSTDPKIERTPRLPEGCTSPDGCGCVLASVETTCDCVENRWWLTATYTATIYVNTSKWTPEWWIRRHERGHVTDHLEVLKTVMSQTGGPFSSEPTCKAAADALRKAVDTQAEAKARQRDFFVRRLCW